MKKIIIIIPYYGKLKNYFNVFLETVRGNPTINWLLMTDDSTKYDYPPNIKVIYNTFDDLRQLVQSKFDFPICLPNPYKLCDFKPAYGYIFDKYIQNFDFWGFCDIDMVFGNIRHFITENYLEQYSRIYQYGHFSLFRNTEKWNRFFMDANELSIKKHFADYRQVFSSPSIFFFDEFNPNRRDGTADMWRELYPEKICLETPMDDIRWPAFNYFAFKSCNNSIGQFIIFEYDNGCLNRCYVKNNHIVKEESLYAHFHLWNIKECKVIDNKFIIVPAKVIPHFGLTVSFVKKYTRGRYLLWIKYKVINKIKNLFNGRK